jgi:NAD(P)H-nitrite reductase large subunit
MFDLVACTSLDFPFLLAMSWDKFHLFKAVLAFIIPYSFTALRQKISAIIHKQTYHSLPPSSCKNVVVIGGSFAGAEIVKKLVHGLPTGYRCILIEKNSHLNYLFAFPRNSVISGYEKYAFIPYGGIAKGAPGGIFEHMQGEAVGISADHISLANGNSIPYAYLVIATGTSSLFPSKVSSIEREGAIVELKGMQSKISKAKKIAVIGGGAVGVQLSSDIKSFFPEKDVALIHSRGQLMPTFGKRLHDYALKVLTEDLGVAVLLGERPEIPREGGSLKLLNGKEDQFDLIVSRTHGTKRGGKTDDELDTMHRPATEL